VTWAHSFNRFDLSLHRLEVSAKKLVFSDNTGLTA
jgi:hypothetical protein